MALTNWQYFVELDLAKDFSWNTDESARFLQATITRGRDNALAPMAPGTMILAMQNRDGRYSLLSTLLSGWDHFIPVRLWCRWTIEATTNIVDNPSVEKDVTGWTTSGALAQNTSISRMGENAARTFFTGAGPHDVSIVKRSGSRFDVASSSDYTFSIFVGTGTVVGIDDLVLEIEWYDSTPSLISTSSLAAVSQTSDWVRHALTATSPSNAVTARLRVTAAGNHGSWFLHLDGAQFEKKSAVTPYCDGDQPGCTWSGGAVRHDSDSSRPANPEFLIFEGYVTDVQVKDNRTDTTAQITCEDRLAIMGQAEINLGNMEDKNLIVQQLLDRLIDKMEGRELSANPGAEWLNTTNNPLTNWSALLGATVTAQQGLFNTDADLMLEGDWKVRADPPGSVIDEGARYTATGDITVAQKYVISGYVISQSGTPTIKMSVKRDTTEIASVSLPIGDAAYTRFEVEVDFSTLGTNQYIDFLTTTVISTFFEVDGIHIVKKIDHVDRDLTGAQLKATLVNAFHERAATILDEIVRSDLAIAFMSTLTKAKGNTLSYRGANNRFGGLQDLTPRIAVADGESQMGFFREGFGVGFSARDRITKATVSSRGTPKRIIQITAAFQLSPVRDTSVGDVFRAPYNAPIRQARARDDAEVAYTKIKRENGSQGEGADIEITTAETPAFFDIAGWPWQFPQDASVVEKTADIGLPVENVLPVEMPLEQTSSQNMIDEAQRLIDKYKNAVFRASVPLHQGQHPDLEMEDETQGWQANLQIGDVIHIRANNLAGAPGFEGVCWVEGLSHTITQGEVHHTSVLVEEAP